MQKMSKIDFRICKISDHMCTYAKSVIIRTSPSLNLILSTLLKGRINPYLSILPELFWVFPLASSSKSTRTQNSQKSFFFNWTANCLSDFLKISFKKPNLVRSRPQ